MDAVYILGSGSLAENKEIKYSLRSLEQNMSDLRDVYIVGELPEFLTGVKHIPARDIYKKGWQNALSKTRLACSLDEVSEEFLFMNDDFFMLEPFVGAELPFYAEKGGSGGVNGRHLFTIHCPIRFKKEWYLKMPLDTEMKGDWSPRSFYGNFYRAPATFCEDRILRTGDNTPGFHEQTAGYDFFSISNGTMLDKKVEEFLETLYPAKSRFERVLLHTKDFAKSGVLA